MTNRVWNFNPGPSTLPLAALETAQRELLDYKGTGMSIIEHSHRGKDYEAVHFEAMTLLRELMGIPDNYYVMFMQGGASAQFALVPMNLLAADKSADYVLTGVWAEKALSEAKLLGKTRVAATTKQGEQYTRVPKTSELDLDPKAAYVHITSNNTIYGTQFHSYPDTEAPLVADMSSDILFKPIDVSKFGLIYAGAQKNMGPAGVTVVIARKDLVDNGRTDIPKIFRYKSHAESDSLYNTIPTFNVYLMRNVLLWVKAQGGLAAMEKLNRSKAELLYGTIDKRADYYRCPVEKESRSWMNPVFRLPTEDLETKFVAEAKAAKLVGLKGHRNAGGIRVSMYNAMPLEGIEALTKFMDSFANNHKS